MKATSARDATARGVASGGSSTSRARSGTPSGSKRRTSTPGRSRTPAATTRSRTRSGAGGSAGQRRDAVDPRYLDAAEQPEHLVPDEDVAWLPRCGMPHVLGRYGFRAYGPVGKAPRALRDPAEADDDETPEGRLPWAARSGRCGRWTGRARPARAVRSYAGLRPVTWHSWRGDECGCRAARWSLPKWLPWPRS